MRLLVTGADGQVGWHLRESLASLGDVVALTRENCDLLQSHSLPGIIEKHKPDVVVNAAAYTAVDQAENEEDVATAINATATGVLASAARAANALFVHYSTDYVFSGSKQGIPYAEDDPPDPVSAYGRSKLAGEIATARASGDFLILRTSWVFSARGRNFVRTILRLAKERDTLSVVNDQNGAPTWAKHIAEATAEIVRKAVLERNTGNFKSGLFHLAASGETTWFDFAKAILQQATTEGVLDVRKLPTITPVTSEQYALPARRPKNSRLSLDRIAKRFGIVLPSWQQGLTGCLKEIKAAA